MCIIIINIFIFYQLFCLLLSKVKPVVNQICTDLCCSLPQELVAFSSSYNIELLTHNDPTSKLTYIYNIPLNN